VRRWPRVVLDDLERRKRPVSISARLAFLATIAEQQSDELGIVGGALYALGLVPDFGLLDKPEELQYRIGERNLPTVRRLTDEGATPLERALQLPIVDPAFRSRLLGFFRVYPPGDVQRWGEVIATQPAWRDLSLEHWRFEDDGATPRQVRIDLDAPK